jgi:hypothetical protein
MNNASHWLYDRCYYLGRQFADAVFAVLRVAGSDGDEKTDSEKYDSHDLLS